MMLRREFFAVSVRFFIMLETAVKVRDSCCMLFWSSRNFMLKPACISNICLLWSNWEFKPLEAPGIAEVALLAEPVAAERGLVPVVAPAPVRAALPVPTF